MQSNYMCKRASESFGPLDYDLTVDIYNHGLLGDFL
jgi:hypothetical protein